MSAQQETTWKLTSKGAGGQCEHCPRTLATHYVVTSSTGQTMTVGRGCLKKVTGWTLTAAQAAAKLRLAEREVRWEAWCAANPAEAAIVIAGADREAAEIRERRRQCAGPAQELKTVIGEQSFGWRNLLAQYLSTPGLRISGVTGQIPSCTPHRPRRHPMTLADGAIVLYHGSQKSLHGEWQLAGPCTCQRCLARAISGGEVGWELTDVRGPGRITCVRRESFTPYDELPQTASAPVHKTTTSQPTGYAEDPYGVRRFDRRGRAMRDKGSFAMCTCGWLSAGANREEARSNARRHREEQAALHQRELEAALAALRVKLKGAAV